MPTPSAETSFKKGLAALADGRHLEAADLFLQAMQIETRRQIRPPDMRFLSYYGLSLARAHRRTHAALEACELAVRNEPDHPILLLNLGRVHLLRGQIGPGLACLEQGLRLCPEHGPLRKELSRHDRRARPVIPFLSRSNSLNHWGGRLRSAVRNRSDPRFAARGTRAARRS